MKENNLIVFFADGAIKIFKNTREYIMSAHDLLFSFRTDDGVWFLNKSEVKCIYNCDDEKFSDFLRQLDASDFCVIKTP